VFEHQLTEELETVAKTLDLPEQLAEEAVLRYEAVAAWLGEEGSPLAQYSPEIYAQGSFRLGTPVRVLRKNDEFDIDLVCRLVIAKQDTSQQELKQNVGDRLRAAPHLYDELESCRRCWRLSYPTKFHLDVLPAIPDQDGGDTHILLTDCDLREWQHSNPIGYANWFFDRMRVVLREAREAFARAAKASIEDVPEWRVRTPLQRAVQLLKRHRDVYFEGHDENRPVSIIITTLAAHAYRQEADLYAALLNIAMTMDRYIVRCGDKWWVANPTQPEENFADKWNEKPERKDAFGRWLETLKAQITAAGRVASGDEARTAIAKGFHPRTRTGTQIGIVGARAVPVLAGREHCRPAPWPLALSYKCSVRGWVYPDVRKGRRLWELTDRPVPKKIGLRFEASTNVPPPYKVFWQIVNTGAEAQSAHGLRGGFDDSDGPREGVRWEATAYAGTHWIEAFVVRNGQCVARSGPRYVRIAR
jgi:hypothetical protein